MPIHPGVKDITQTAGCFPAEDLFLSLSLSPSPSSPIQGVSLRWHGLHPATCPPAQLDERAGARECSKDAKLDDWDGYQGAGTFRGYFVILEQNPLAVL